MGSKIDQIKKIDRKIGECEYKVKRKLDDNIFYEYE